MDCISEIESELVLLADRPVAPAFHIAVIERALEFIRQHLPPEPTGALSDELRMVCDEAMDAVGDLKTSLMPTT